MRTADTLSLAKRRGCAPPASTWGSPVKFSVSQHELAPCPPAGQGVHVWIMSAAHYCRRCGMSKPGAVQYISDRLTRLPKPPNEVEIAVHNSYHRAGAFGSAIHQCPATSRRAVPMSEIKYHEARLRAAAEQIKIPANWRHWLWERSPIRPETQNAISFLSHLYRPDEKVFAFDKISSPDPRWSFTIKNPMDCRVPVEMRHGGRFLSGIWFLCNPVDGLQHPNPRQNGRLSCRSEESIAAFRYVVIESDIAPPNLWLAFVVQIPARIAAIYTSGSRSIHTLIQVDAKSKADWDAIVGPWKRPLKALGGDAACLSAVRLSRLPGCARPEKNGFQKLLYLAPNPPDARITDLPRVRVRSEMLQRWREICPRWTPDRKAEM